MKVDQNMGVTSKIVSIFLVGFIYAIIRYNVFNGVPLENIPLYTMNKVFAFTGITLLSLSAIVKRYKSTENNNRIAKNFGQVGFSFIIIHVLSSLPLLNESYFSKFYNQGKFNLIGELSLLFGITALFFMSFNQVRLFVKSCNNENAEVNDKYKGLSLWGIILTLGHVLVMGFNGWLTPSVWPGYMVPISLLSFLILMVALLARMKNPSH